MYVTSTMQGQTPEQKQIAGVHRITFAVAFQTDDGSVVRDVGWNSHDDASYRMVHDAVDEGHIGHEFEPPSRIRSLIDGPLQDVGFSYAFEKVIKVLAVGDENGIVQVASPAIARLMIVHVSTRIIVRQNETINEVNLESDALFLEHDLQRSLYNSGVERI